MTDNDWKEHYIRRGDPSKPTYYIIRLKSETSGLFYRYTQFAGHVKRALYNGWIPVVDMQNYLNPYLSPDKLGKENSWEYFFEQPLRIGVEQAYSGENILLSEANFISDYPHWGMSFFENRDGILSEWRMLLKLGLLKIKPALLKEISAIRKKIFMPNERILGVHLRGTDYVDKKLKWHPIPPPTEFAVSTVVAKLKEWNCNKVFLATEDKIIFNMFKETFGDACLTFDREYIDYKQEQKFLSKYRFDRPNDHFLQGKEYLTEMILLSMCNSFVAARCSGSVAVALMTKGFEHTYFFNLGRYGVISLD